MNTDIDNMFVHLTNVSYQKQSVRENAYEIDVCYCFVFRKITILFTEENGRLII